MSENLEQMLPEATENQSAENIENSAIKSPIEEKIEPVIETSEIYESEVSTSPEVLVADDLPSDNLEIVAESVVEEETVKEALQSDIDMDSHNVIASEKTLEIEELPMVHYNESMTINEIVSSIKSLIKEHPVQIISKHVEELKRLFNIKFGTLLKEAKSEFLANGGESAEFHFENDTQKEYNEVLFEYKKLRQKYQTENEGIQKSNLTKKQALIDDLKYLIENGSEEGVYKKFKEIQLKWREIGPVPRENYTDLWRTYHFHVERFYDLLHLSNELRDMDFKHNYDEKLKIVNRVEELAESDDIKAAFDELQILHRLWKEEIGPVSREHREELWIRFSEATHKIHERRQEYFDAVKGEFDENLKKKEEILEKLISLNAVERHSHSDWQKSVNEAEKIRKEFIESGRVPKNKDKEIWEKFREVNKQFNITKNEYYKDIKKDQHGNLDKKMKLVEQAESLRESEDWAQSTEIMKRIQGEWKNIGHVPKQYSDKLWNRFKEACNFYFDRLRKEQDANTEIQMSVYIQKKNFLENLKTESEKEGFKPDIEQLKKYIAEWKELGAVPPNQRYIEAKFNKFLDPYFENLSSDKSQNFMIRYKNMIDTYLEQKDAAKLNDEIQFVRKRVDSVSKEKQQMETNRMFFSNADDNNPMIRKIMNEIDKLSLELSVWEAKLQYLRSIDF